jgi:hypothetical protein
MTSGPTPASGETPPLQLAWDADFAAQIGGMSPVDAVGMAAFMDPVHKAEALAKYAAVYAGSENDDAFAVVVSGTPSDDFNAMIASGARAVVACAPLEATAEDWHIGLAAPGRTLGMFEQQQWLSFPAVALPVAAGGLRVWLGRLRNGEPPIIDQTLNSGIDSAGNRVRSWEGPITPMTRHQVRQFCPGAVFIEPPAWRA